MKKHIIIICICILIFGFFVYLLFSTLFPGKKLQPTKQPTKPLIVNKSFNPRNPDLNSIFSQNHQWISTISAERKRTLITTGDIIPARSVNYHEVKYNNFLWPYEKVAGILKNADITFTNLESPLIKNCQPAVEGMVFCGDERNVNGLVFAGIDIVNLANNHTGNYGLDGVNNTVKVLKQANIQTTGISKETTLNIKGINFSFLGYNNVAGAGDYISWAEEQKIKKEISAINPENIIIVAFHWGDEYTNMPNKKQKELAHLAVNSGADLVIGNHPHWIQGVEFYKDKLIVYAHGNLVFDQMWSEKTKEGVIGRYTFYNNKLIDVEFIPTYIKDYGQPETADTQKAKQILEEMENNSKLIQ